MPDTQIFAVAGRPIFHSRSPDLFRAAFAAHGASGAYVRMVASTARESLHLFREIGFSGMNVTAPFKVDMVELLDDLDEHARSIGAVNAIVRREGEMKGYNTDWQGVVGPLCERGIQLNGRRCIVVGAGGAGRAAAYGLKKEGADVVILNRTAGRAERAASDVGCSSDTIEKLGWHLGEASILVWAIPGHAELVRDEWLRSDLTIIDANYTDKTLIARARKHAAPCISGEEWLIHQAVASYEMFTGRTVDASVMRRTILQPRPKGDSIALIGFMGSGKSSFGRVLSSKLGYRFVDMDEDIETQEKRSIGAILEDVGEKAFREIEKRHVREMAGSRKTVFSCGGGAILDEENRSIIAANATAVWLYSSPQTAVERIPPGTRPLLVSENPVHTAESILNARIPLYAGAADMVIGTDGRTPMEAAEIVCDEIGKIIND